MRKKIAVLVGSLRKESFNRKMAKAVIALARETFQLDIIEIGDLPLYNQDYDDEGKPPSPWVEFRNRLRSYDGFLFVTPEYNRSVPAPLKNAIDVGSRPYGQSVWGGKPGAIISVSPGAIGGFGANHHLRQSMVFLDVPIMQQPEAYIASAGKLFDERGELVNQSVREYISKYMQSFAAWVETIMCGGKY